MGGIDGLEHHLRCYLGITSPTTPVSWQPWPWQGYRFVCSSLEQQLCTLTLGIWQRIAEHCLPYSDGKVVADLGAGDGTLGKLLQAGSAEYTGTRDADLDTPYPTPECGCLGRCPKPEPQESQSTSRQRQCASLQDLVGQGWPFWRVGRLKPNQASLTLRKCRSSSTCCNLAAANVENCRAWSRKLPSIRCHTQAVEHF